MYSGWSDAISAIGDVITSVFSSIGSTEKKEQSQITYPDKQMSLYELLALQTTYSKTDEGKFDKYIPLGLLVLSILVIASMTIKAKGA